MKATRLAGMLCCKRTGNRCGEDSRLLSAKGPLRRRDRHGYRQLHSLLTSLMLVHGLSACLRAFANSSSSSLTVIPRRVVATKERKLQASTSTAQCSGSPLDPMLSSPVV